MKINDESLKSAYRAHVWSNTPVSRDACPPAERMIKLLRGAGSRKEKAKLIDHISGCRYCAEEFEFLVEARRNEKDLIQDVGRWLGRKDRDRLPPALFSRFSWGLASLLAGFVVAGFFIVKFLVLPAPETYRADSRAMIELLQPVDTRIPRSDLIFRWKALSQTEYYVLEIFDEALAPVWESGKITAIQAAPPREITGMLALGRTYFWLVTAHLAGGEQIHSSLVEFMLKE
jgi:hypothetical protein